MSDDHTEKQKNGDQLHNAIIKFTVAAAVVTSLTTGGLTIQEISRKKTEDTKLNATKEAIANQTGKLNNF